MNHRSLFRNQRKLHSKRNETASNVVDDDGDNDHDDVDGSDNDNDDKDYEEKPSECEDEYFYCCLSNYVRLKKRAEKNICGGNALSKNFHSSHLDFFFFWMGMRSGGANSIVRLSFLDDFFVDFEADDDDDATFLSSSVDF